MKGSRSDQRRINVFEVVVLLLISAFFHHTSWGFLPPGKTTTDDKSTYKGPGSSFALRAVPGQIQAKKRSLEWKQFTTRYGEACSVRWNETTGTPARIIGQRIATGLNRTSSNPAVEVWARSFVNENKNLLGIDSNSLKLRDLRRAGGHTYILFGQTYNGLPVYNSHLKMNIDDVGNLVSLSSSCHPDVKCSLEVKLSPEEAARQAAGRISAKKGKADSARFTLKQAEQVVFPVPTGGSDPFRLCYLLKIHLDDPLGDWIVVIDASRATEYVRYNNYRFGTISGNVTGEILPAYYDDTPVAVDLQGETIHVYDPTPIYAWSMSTDPGWTTQGLWAWGTPNGVGGDDGGFAPVSGRTGSNVYAYNLTGGYEYDLSTVRYLTTTAIDCSTLTGTQLSFWRWLGVASSNVAGATVEVSNDGSNWTVLWKNLLGTDLITPGWQRVVYDLSSVADGYSTVYVRWGIGPTRYWYSLSGWYIDDVEIYANGGSSTTTAAGNYSVDYSGTGNEQVYAEMSGPYQSVYYEDGRCLSYSSTVPAGTHSWTWSIPALSTVLSWDLNTNPGWTTQGDWSWGTPQGNEGDPSSGHTGSSVYGNNLAGAYANDIDPPQYLTTAAIDCSLYRGTHLRFWRWLGVEYYDDASVEVSTDGSNWIPVFVNYEYYADIEDTSWTQVIYDIATLVDGHSSVYIRWGLASDYSITFCGWNIDDIELLADVSGSDVRPGVYDSDEINVFYHMTVAHNHIKNIEPAFTGMDYQVPAMVRVDTDFPNAFWDGEGLNFGEGDGTYLRNLALFSDVIYHEYNHGITHQLYPYPLLPYMGESGALDEAWSDYFACDITDEPLLGEGDLVIGEPFMRTLDNTLRFRDNWSNEVHDDGRIVGGAMWDLRQALGSSFASDLLHFSRYNRAETFLDYYEDVLLTDDTNSNLADGTPNMLEIADAFGAHGIGGLQVQNMDQQVTSEVLDNDKLDAGESADLLLQLRSYLLANNVMATLTSSSPYVSILNGSSAYGNFSYGQEKNTSGTPIRLGIDDLCPEDEILDSTLTLSADGGYSTSQLYRLINAPDQILYDDGAATSYFGHSTPSGGFAVRFTPPAYPATITSVRLWPYPSSAGVTLDLHAWVDDGTGGSPGSEMMVPKTVTVAGSGSWEEFPLTTQYFGVAYEWNLDTNPGWSTEGGWAFGVPQGGYVAFLPPDPTSGFTGTNVYGYNLLGDYPNNMAATEYLKTSAIDCSALSGVHLRFYRWLGVESSEYDHASIDVSNDGSAWTRVWENYYTVQDLDGWTQLTYDISAVADGQSTVYIRWGMGPTDDSWTHCGWNLDDIQILQVVASTPGITITHGDVYLGWTQHFDTYYNGVTTRNSDRRSWVKDLAFGWLQLDGEGFIMDVMVRARYDLDSLPTGVTEWSAYR